MKITLELPDLPPADPAGTVYAPVIGDRLRSDEAITAKRLITALQDVRLADGSKVQSPGRLLRWFLERTAEALS